MKRSPLRKKSKKPALTTAYVRNKVLWPLVSKFVRLSETDDYGYGNCVTCGANKHWKEFQAGHFNPGRHNAILFDVRGIHIQCYHCNVGLKGNPRPYNAWMIKNMGQKVVDELDALANTTVQFDMVTLLSMVSDYKEKVSKLLESKLE